MAWAVTPAEMKSERTITAKVVQDVFISQSRHNFNRVRHQLVDNIYALSLSDALAEHLPSRHSATPRFQLNSRADIIGFPPTPYNPITVECS